MNTNVCLTATLRQPFRSLLLLILFGLITFGFMTKAVEFILIQRETEVLGSYYRSIGILENIADPQSRDISAGIDLIETSPSFGFGDQREFVSGVMAETYNVNYLFSNFSGIENVLPEEEWPNVHMTDVWVIGDLVQKEALLTKVENGEKIGYILKFSVDTVLAAYPEYAKEGSPLGLIFLFNDHEAAIPLIEQMGVGQRYFIRGWEDIGAEIPRSLVLTQGAYLVLKPLDGGQIWYLPLEEGKIFDINDPALAPFKDEIDLLNENLHTLGIIATADMSAMPLMQESARFYYLTEGRWLNHQDDVDGKNVIVVPEEFSILRDLELGDDLQFTFRPLKDTYFGFIRDGVDAQNWRGYATHQEPYRIVGIYTSTKSNTAFFGFIPTHSLPPGFTSVTQDQFGYFVDYSFVLDSTRHETEFVQAYQGPLEELGIRLTFLENNGPAYWASVDPILRSLSADLQVFGGLLVIALILAVFLYQRQRRRDYAILRALGVPARRANAQLVRPLFLLSGIGIASGGLTAWNYALDQARETLSTIPTPAGISSSAELSPIFLAGLCAAVFLLLVLLTLLSAFSLARNPVFELLQGESAKIAAKLKSSKAQPDSPPLPPISSSLVKPVDKEATKEPKPAADRTERKIRRKYTPASLGRYMLQHGLRSRLKSFLTVAVALSFVLAAGWIRQTITHSQMEVDRLYDTTVVEADILPVGSFTREEFKSGFVYRKAIQSILDNEFVESNVLEADTTWLNIKKIDADEEYTGKFPVYAFDSAEAFYSGLGNPDSLDFAPGWDLDRFAGPRTFEEIQNEGVPAIFPASLLEGLEIEIGERIRIAGPGYTYLCLVVGKYAGQLASSSTTVRALNPAGNYILIPLSVLETIEGGQTKYTVAHFSLDPARNRELAQFRADMEEVMDVYAGSARLVVWDEELRIVINQLEQNISLLEVLYPVVIVVSALVGAGLSYLLLLQMTREAAILRVLGTTQTAVRLALISEPVILSLIGVAISLVIASFMWTRSGLVPIGTLLISAGLYLAGALAGAVAGAISVTNKKPLELLQVKE